MPVVTPLIDEKRIAAHVSTLADQIGRDYADRPLTLLCCLKGAAYFTTDLSKAITIPHRIAFVRIASYGDGTVSSGEVRLDYLSEEELADRDVLLVEDIIDTGRSAATLMERLEKLPIRSLGLCAFLDKPSRREVEIALNYVGLTIDDHFVVGYGLDLAEEYRHLPFIGVLNQEEPSR